MGRKPGSRLTQRKAKREVAKATRTTKYADQKGGGSNTKRFKGRKRSDVILDQPAYMRDAPDQEEDEPEQTDDDRAIRAFQKKLRQIEELKLRRKRGDELNDDQLDKINQEAAILKKIIELTAPADGDGAEAVLPAAKAAPVKAKKRRRL